MLNASSVYTLSGSGLLSTSGEYILEGTLMQTGGTNLVSGSLSVGPGVYNLNGGALILNGTLSSAITVKSGVVLGGTGSLSSVIVSSGGILARQSVGKHATQRQSHDPLRRNNGL